MSECHRTRDLMGPYLYHELDGEELRFVQAHLATCRECTAEFAAGEAVVAQVPRSAFAPSREARERMSAALEREAAQVLAKRRRRRHPAWGLPIPALAAAMALALGILIGYQLPRASQPHRIVPAPVALERPASSMADGGTQAATISAENKSAEVLPTPPSHEAAVPPPSVASNRQLRPRIRPPEPAVATGQVLRPPRPQGVDDVQVAEVIQ